MRGARPSPEEDRQVQIVRFKERLETDMTARPSLGGAPNIRIDITARVRRRRRRTRPDMPASFGHARLVVPAAGRGAVGPIPVRN